MQDRTNAVKDGCRIGRMLERTDAGQDGCRLGQKQDRTCTARTDAGQVYILRLCVTLNKEGVVVYF